MRTVGFRRTDDRSVEDPSLGGDWGVTSVAAKVGICCLKVVNK